VLKTVFVSLNVTVSTRFLNSWNASSQRPGRADSEWLLNLEEN
jgi:hypothetical protein